MLPLLLRSLTLLAATASCVALFFIELRVKSMSAFLSANELASGVRNLVILQVLVAAVLAFGAGLIYAWKRRASAAIEIRWLAHLTAPLILMPFVPALLIDGFADLTVVVAAFAIFVLVLEQLLRLSLRAWDSRHEMTAPRWVVRATDAVGGVAARLRLSPRVARHLPLLLVLIGVAFYAAYIGRYTLYNHRKFGTMAFDLGIYENMVYSVLHGRPMRAAVMGLEEPWSNLRNHADLGVFLVAPFYAIKPAAETILIFQAIVLAAGALPLFFFARRRLSPALSVVVAYAYLCYPPLHGANFYDFHFQPIAAVLVMAAIWAMDARRWYLYAAFFGMALICREDISIGLGVLGLFAFFSGYRVRAGAISAVVALTYFVVMRFAIMPAFGTWWFSNIYRDLLPAGDGSFRGVVLTLLSNPAYVMKTLLTPEKLRYALQILAPMAFLPVRRVFLASSLLMGAFSTLLTTGYGPTLDTGFQYNCHFVGYTFPAAAVALHLLGLRQDGRVRRGSAAITLAVATILSTLIWGAFSPKESVHGGFGTVHKTPPSAADLQKEKDLQELASKISHDARVAVSETELPHLSTRLNIFDLRDGLFDAEFLLYDVRAMGGSRGEEAERSGQYELMETRGSLKLLRRKQAPPPPH